MLCFSLTVPLEPLIKEIEAVLYQPSITVKQPTQTRWLSHEQAVHSLRKCLSSVKLVCQQEAMKGDATALGLATHLSKPTFVVILLLMSDVLALLANLSRLLQVSTLNLLYVEGNVQDTIHTFEILKDNPFESSYMSMLKEILDSVEAGDSLDKQHLKKVAHDYISTLVTKLHEHFPQVHLLSLLGYFDPRNVHKAELMSTLEVGIISIATMEFP